MKIWHALPTWNYRVTCCHSVTPTLLRGNSRKEFHTAPAWNIWRQSHWALVQDIHVHETFPITPYQANGDCIISHWVSLQKRFSSSVQFSSVQSRGRVRLSATPWTAARQASLSITNSWSFLKLMSIESVMPSNHLILCCPLLLRRYISQGSREKDLMTCKRQVYFKELAHIIMEAGNLKSNSG